MAFSASLSWSSVLIPISERLFGQPILSNHDLRTSTIVIPSPSSQPLIFLIKATLFQTSLTGYQQDIASKGPYHLAYFGDFTFSKDYAGGILIFKIIHVLLPSISTPYYTSLRAIFVKKFKKPSALLWNRNRPLRQYLSRSQDTSVKGLVGLVIMMHICSLKG